MEDSGAHEGLDARIIDAEKAGAPLVFGRLEYGDDGVTVIADPQPGTPDDFVVWLDPLLRSWAQTERVSLVTQHAERPAPD